MLVRMRGLEPPLPCENQNLNLARLPIPPHPHVPNSSQNSSQLLASNNETCNIMDHSIMPTLEPEANDLQRLTPTEPTGEQTSGAHSDWSAPSGPENVTKVSQSSRRRRGTGNVYLRGKTWWLYYGVNGKMFRESARTKDRETAEGVLASRLSKAKTVLNSRGVLLIGKQASRLLSRENTAANIGAIAELLVSADLMNRGYDVFRAINPNSSCDLVFIDGDGKPRRVEVKTGIADEAGAITACSPISTLESFDLLAVATRDGRIIYSEDLSALPRKCFTRKVRGSVSNVEGAA